MKLLQLLPSLILLSPAHGLLPIKDDSVELSPPPPTEATGPCGCRPVWGQLICGSDGTTYFNRCEFDCLTKNSDQDIKIDCRGACPCKRKPGCDCRGKLYDPVCGVNLKTYKNDCERECARDKDGNDVDLLCNNWCSYCWGALGGLGNKNLKK